VIDRSRDAWCWGANNEGQLGNGTQQNSTVPVRVAGDMKWQSLTAGAWHTCGITSVPARLYCWGSNTFGQLGTGVRN
jgi:hypothetical protein